MFSVGDRGFLFHGDLGSFLGSFVLWNSQITETDDPAPRCAEDRNAVRPDRALENGGVPATAHYNSCVPLAQNRGRMSSLLGLGLTVVGRCQELAECHERGRID